MKPRRFLLIGSGLLLVLLVVISVFVLNRENQSIARLSGNKISTVILITLDTTRADRIGCYGFQGIETPTIDFFAARGDQV